MSTPLSPVLHPLCLTLALQRRGERQQGQKHAESGGCHGSGAALAAAAAVSLRCSSGPQQEAGSALCARLPPAVGF